MTPEQLRNQIKDQNAHNLLDHGYKGFRIIDSTFSATAGEVFFKLRVVVTADITAVNGFGGDNPDGSVDYSPNAEIYGHFAAADVSVTKGAVIGYLV